MAYNLKKILTVSQTQAADAYTIANEPISSLQLMERASEAFVASILPKLRKNQKIAILCGTGNNGGDGLAVARILQKKGFSIKCFLIKASQTVSADCATNLEKFSKVEIIETEAGLPDFSGFDIIIDALFGSGLSRPITGLMSGVISGVNNSNKLVYSIDIPSGLYCDNLPDSAFIIKSDLTVSFQRPKLVFFFPESGGYVNEWLIAEIGLDEDFIQSRPSDYFILDQGISKLAKERQRYSHKGTYGHSLIIAGSYGKMGAAVLSCKACLRSGVGLLTTYVPKSGYEIMQISVPEAMCLTDNQETHVSSLPDLSVYNSVGIGPGIGEEGETQLLLEGLLKQAKQPLVIDADALNILATNKELLKKLPQNTILTPHPKEFERLVGAWNNSIERLEKQKDFSKKYQCIVVLKDAFTSISDMDGKVYFNTSGNAGMATGGSGDVLTGIITGLLAQGYPSIQAALIGVYFHGKAGDDAAKKKGMNALLASDIVDCLAIEKD